MRHQGLAGAIWDDLCDDIAILFQHPHNDGLALATLSAGAIAADVRLVDLDLPIKHPVAVYQRHMLANLVSHPPSGLVGDA